MSTDVSVRMSNLILIKKNFFDVFCLIKINTNIESDFLQNLTLLNPAIL